LDLRNADFSQADLTNTNLEHSDLRGASFYRTKLMGANLRSAQLQDANLLKSDLTRCSLKYASYNENTKFPQGFNPAEHGMSFSSQSDQEDERSEFKKVVGLSMLSPGKRLLVNIRGEYIMLLNINGEVCAIGSICPHADASLYDGEVYQNEEWIIECPLHGACFNIQTGKSITSWEPNSINIYEIKIDNGDIYVKVSRI